MKKKISNLVPDASLSIRELFNVRGGTADAGKACGCSKMCKKKACKTKATEQKPQMV
jgi:hypothetical protein